MESDRVSKLLCDPTISFLQAIEKFNFQVVIRTKEGYKVTFHDDSTLTVIDNLDSWVISDISDH